MIIKYEKTQYMTTTHEIDIPDTKNVFLKGTNPYDGLSTYFGIWTNKNCLVIVTLIGHRNISYEYSLNISNHTESDIKQYLERNKNVQKISKEEFQKELNFFIELVKM